ncbi:MAG: hypothetical protein HC821_01630 [Lewinella sp.]|nr:hypothetical protein [Lewinella sp.]
MLLLRLWFNLLLFALVLWGSSGCNPAKKAAEAGTLAELHALMTAATTAAYKHKMTATTTKSAFKCIPSGLNALATGST